MSRIGVFTYSTQPRGSVVHAVHLSEALARQGHDVTLFALSKNGAGFFREVECQKCLLPAAEAPAEMDALIAQRIEELCRGLVEHGPALDLLHAQDCLVASGLLRARRASPALAACPLLRTVHHVERFESPYLAECQRRSIQEADLVLSVSRMTAEDVHREFGRASLAVSNGVDAARFEQPRAPRAELRRGLGLPAEALLVLSIGGVEPRKNSLRCLLAFAELAQARSDALWVIAGGASVLDHREYVARFEAELAALPETIRRRVVRTGMLPEARLTDSYHGSDVLLAAAEHEGFGLNVLEGMAAGLPVVVPARPPFTEYVPAGAAAFVDPESPASIAAALLELSQSPERRAHLGALGPGIARSFSWDSSAREHAAIYQRALGL